MVRNNLSGAYICYGELTNGEVDQSVISIVNVRFIINLAWYGGAFTTFVIEP